MITLNGKTIIVADDELGFRELISEELALVGANPIAVDSGEQVVPHFVKQAIHAVISDVRMPRIDGLILLDLIKKENCKFPVFMMTGFSDANTEDIYNRGADGLYAKPCDMDQVVRDMHRAFLPEGERYVQTYPRSESAVSFSLTIESSAELRGAQVNLGRGGVFLKANGPLPRVNAEVHFSIRLQEEKVEFKGIGLCRWSKTLDGIGDAFGLHIVQLDPEANAFYLEWLKANLPIASIPNRPGGNR